MDDTKWVQWLRSVTHEDSVRGIARAAGVSHTTVQRWVTKGVPPQIVWDLTVRFKGDPIAALIVLERVTQQQLPDLNYTAVLPHVPEETITAELHRRAMERRHGANRTQHAERTPERRGFRLTAKM